MRVNDERAKEEREWWEKAPDDWRRTFVLDLLSDREKFEQLRIEMSRIRIEMSRIADVAFADDLDVDGLIEALDKMQWIATKALQSLEEEE